MIYMPHGFFEKGGILYMKKKVLALFTVAVLVIGCSMSALAAESPTADEKSEDQKIEDTTGITAETDGGKAVTVAPIEAEAILTSAKEAAKAIVSSTATLLKVFELSLPDGVELDKTNGTPITIAVPGVEAGQKITVLHFDGTTGKWEEVKVTKVEDGKVTALFKSLSPVAIVTGAKSSKTGEEASLLGFICILALAGAALCTKKFALES